MDRNDQQAIEALFGKLADVERQSPPRDSEAEGYIGAQLQHQPGAAYYMAQTIIVQEQALGAAQARIEELERAAESRPSAGGSLFSGIFGDSRREARPSGSVPRISRAQPEALQAPPMQAMAGQRQGGGFLAGAAQTAMGVAGGLMLGNMLTGMLSGNEAQAAKPPADETPAPENAQAQESSFEGSDAGSFGDFEM